MHEIYELSEADTGTYKVVTASGTVYFLDLTRPFRTLTRLPLEEDADPGFDLAPASILRRDGETLRLLKLDTLQVGDRGSLWVDVREDGVLTWRGTTPVISITELGG